MELPWQMCDARFCCNNYSFSRHITAHSSELALAVYTIHTQSPGGRFTRVKLLPICPGICPTLGVLPIPSWPCVLSPQQAIPPLSSRAQAWVSPAATAEAVLSESRTSFSSQCKVASACFARTKKRRSLAIFPNSCNSLHTSLHNRTHMHVAALICKPKLTPLL
jgi:hypothetical protein